MIICCDTHFIILEKKQVLEKVLLPFFRKHSIYFSKLFNIFPENS